MNSNAVIPAKPVPTKAGSGNPTSLPSLPRKRESRNDMVFLDSGSRPLRGLGRNDGMNQRFLKPIFRVCFRYQLFLVDRLRRCFKCY